MKIRAKSAHYQNFFTENGISINFWWFSIKIYHTLTIRTIFKHHFKYFTKQMFPKVYVWALLIVWLSTIEVEIILFESMFQLPFINFLMRESQYFHGKLILFIETLLQFGPFWDCFCNLSRKNAHKSLIKASRLLIFGTYGHASWGRPLLRYMPIWAFAGHSNFWTWIFSEVDPLW